MFLTNLEERLRGRQTSPMIFGISDEQKRRGTFQPTISSGSQFLIKLKAIKIIKNCILHLEYKENYITNLNM